VSKIDNQSNKVEALTKEVDICIDFSSPAGTLGLCECAAKLNIPVVTGTTGFGDEDMEKMKNYSKVIPILMSANFSLGVHVLRKLVTLASTLFPDSFDIEIIEKHHSQKKDSPSGTALTILDDIKECRGNVIELFGRHGRCVHQSGEVCMHAVRGGDTTGEHNVCFFGQGECVSLTHQATNREVFARGAIFAAEKFHTTAIPKLYSLSDIITPSTGVEVRNMSPLNSK
jgi:4-hydroxy-tetrahydrodipicolinate reductase